MQTRKRAKSITFGKKKSEDEKDEEVLSATPPVVEVTKPTAEPSETTVEKAETVERRAVPEKTPVAELSDTLPKSDDEDDKTETPAVHEVATPSAEFITDDTPSTSSEEPKSESKEPEPSVVTPEPQLETTLSPEQPAPTATSQELSPSPSESAFTIQNGEKEHAPEVVGEGKKRFGIYFFLVAFLAFILGLGAMAAVSYGWVNIPMLKLL